MAKGKRAGVNKMEAVRQVLAKHGKETMPIEIVKFVWTEHGAEMSADMASTYKSSVLKELGQGGIRKGKRGPKPGWKLAAAAANGAKPPAKQGSTDISLEDILAVKKLVDQVGAEKVEQLARVLAK